MGRDRGCGSCQEVLTDFRWRTAWTESLQGLHGVRGSAVTAPSSPGHLPSRSPSITLRRWLGIPLPGMPGPNQTRSRCPGPCRALAVQPCWGSREPELRASTWTSWSACRWALLHIARPRMPPPPYTCNPTRSLKGEQAHHGLGQSL